MTPAEINSRIVHVPFFRFLGFSITRLEETQTDAQIPFADRLIGNPIMEYYHGGIIASFMEAVAAISVNPQFADQPAKPINLTVDYLRPAVKGPLHARAMITRKGKRIASVRTVCWQDDDARPVAEGLYHFLTV